MENYNNPSQPVSPGGDGARARKSILKWILLYVIIGAVAYGAIYYFLFNKNGYNYNTQKYQNNYQNQDSDVKDWKEYSSEEGGFSLKYPADWTIDDRTGEGSLEYGPPKSVTFLGKQGRLQVDYGIGFGGACEEGYQPLLIGSEKFDVCHSILNNAEHWSVAAKDFGKFGIGMFVDINKPYIHNRDFMLKILSTFKFTPR